MKFFNSSLFHISYGILLLLLLSSYTEDKPNTLKPGYNKTELLQILPAMERTYDAEDIGGFKTPSPENMERVYRSKVSPFMNRFDVWRTTDKKAVISIRGTIIDSEAMSATAAAYNLMVSATGKIQISDNTWFEYKLAELPDAGVHLGILLGLSFISPELLEQITIQYNEGIRDFIIIGHSQGSSISLLATSYLWYLRKDGKLPSDINFKTYSIATPKTGNLQYVYDYEKLTAGGYALSVNNVIDWVPCIPLALQSIYDFPKVNPFKDIKNFITSIGYSLGPNFEKGFKEFSNIAPAVTQNLIQGIHENVYPKIAKVLPGYVEPEYILSFNYERSGQSVPLVPDAEYYKLFPNDPENFEVWENHSVYPYYILVQSN